MKITIEHLEFPLSVKDKITKIPKISKLHLDFISGKNIHFNKTNLSIKEPHKIIISNESSCLILISYEDENGKLHEDKTNLLNFINHLLLILKEFFREILLSNDKKKKETTIDILKECYDNDLYKSTDLKEISKDTDSETEVNIFINKESLEKDYDIFKSRSL